MGIFVQECLLEKELVLDEIGVLSNRLRKQAAIGSVDTLHLAKAVNEYQRKVRSTNAKLIACVSEMSMYQVSFNCCCLFCRAGEAPNLWQQALGIKLSNEKKELEEEVAQARTRVAAGEAPTQEAQREWDNMQRTQQIIDKLSVEKADIEELLERQGSGVESTADPRPNAYIPEDLGIPKPYGVHAPFKPSEPGSTIRHIRKPHPLDIII